MLKEDDRAGLINIPFSVFENIDQSQNKPEELVYHFTDAAGLLGILQSNTLWATRADCLNDDVELKHGLAIAREILGKRKSTIAKAAFESLCDPTPEIRIDVYVVSFCGQEDVSGQWLFYGRQGHGFAIGFDPEGINNQWSSVSVLYEEPRQREVLDSKIRECEERATRHISTLASNDREEAQSILVTALSSAIRAVAPCFKHPSFKGEMEWRVFTHSVEGPRISPHRATTPRLREPNGRIIPYTEFILPEPVKSPIREIVLGYQVEERSTNESLQVLFSKVGLTNIEIRRSKVPIRGPIR